MTPFDGSTIVVGVCGGIAAYKACELVSRLVQAGAEVRVVMTRHGVEFVTPVTFQALSGNPVYTETFAAPETYGMGHLSLAGSAAAVVVAPATANILAKAAHGIADDLLSTTLISVTCPVLFAPAMNAAMWANPIVQANVSALREAGHHFVGPESGWLACRQEGQGRMSEPATIVAALRHLLWPERDLMGRTVLVTAGPTHEAIDAVRYLTNPSSGRQGFAIAEAAALRGARAVLVAGPTDLPTPPGVERIDVVSAAQMAEAVLARCEQADIVVGAAAVADYTVPEPATEKVPKSAEPLVLRLLPTVDIIAAVAERRRPGQVIVAFAAETHDLLAHAAAKLRRKNVDLMVANDVTAPGSGFRGEQNDVTILDRAGRAERLGPLSKLEVGHEILRRAAALLEPCGEPESDAAG